MKEVTQNHNKPSPHPSSVKEASTTLNGAMRTLALALSKDLLQQLDAIFPGPGGSSPIAHA